MAGALEVLVVGAKLKQEWNDKLAFTAFTVDLGQYPELVVRLKEHNMVTGDVEWGQAKLALPSKVEDTRLSSLVPLVNRKGKEVGQVQLLVTLKPRDAVGESAEQGAQLNGAPSTPRGNGDLSEEASAAASPPAALSTPTPVEGAALYNPLWQASRHSSWAES
ncbi:hypothetical protein N2152v2_008132 [Parachlorella kessleri]